MIDFVFAPKVMFVSFKFTYLNAFFNGTKDALYICPALKDDQTTPNRIRGEMAYDYLLKFVKKPYKKQ